MAELLEQKSSLGVKLETTYATDPTLAAADIMEFLKGSAFPGYKPDVKDRKTIRNTFSKRAGVRGAELNTEGSIQIELHGSGTGGTAPESDPLWECALGVKTSKTGSTTVASATSSTSFTLTSATNFAIGDAIYVVISSVNEVTWITNLAGAVVTCSPALSVTPSASAVVKNLGVHYSLSTAELKSFWASYWMGDAVRYDYPGCKVGKLSFNFATGEIIEPKFDFNAKNTIAPVTQAYGLGAASYDTTDPLVATLMKFRVGGTTFDVSAATLEIDNTMFKRQAITTSGISKVIRTGRAVSGSFSLLYENKTIDDVFRADTRSELVIVAGTAVGNMFAVRLPKIRYKEVPVSVQSELYQYDVTFEADLTNGEDEINSAVFF